MIEVGGPVPDFRLTCLDPRDGSAFEFLRSRDQRGWLIVMFYPRDFSFICPTELAAFSARYEEFRNLEAEVLAVSVDTLDTHREWLAASPDHGGVGTLRIPLGSDPNGETCRRLGLWNSKAALPNRASLLIGPDGVLEYLVVHNLAVGRSVEEMLRVLQALRTGGLCPASWTDEHGTLDPAAMLDGGRVLGHYRMRQLLGSGNFGTVFSAWDLRLERQVALKVLRHTDEESRRALLGEARAAARISNPFVCTIHSVEELDHLPVIVMQFVDGGPLTQRLKAGGVTEATARRMVRQVAEGLAAAHELGVVHGDLKPANILLAQDRPCLVDFGMAQSRHLGLTRPELAVGNETTRVAAESGTDAALADLPLDATRSWIPLPPRSGADGADRPVDLDGTLPWGSETARLYGTPAYMSPEQAEGRLAQCSSDIFALGLIFAEMLDGRRVLDEDTLPALLHALRSGRIAERVSQRLGDRFPKSCLSMFSPDPADRPTARQVVAALG